MAILDPGFTFENFVVGPANRLASAAARRAAERPGVSYNPLFIHAPAGLGKTHLLGSIAYHATQVAPNRVVEYRTSEEFLRLYLEASGEIGEDEVRRQYREVDILLLDDVQLLTTEPDVQDLLLLTLDALTDDGKQVVLASDRPPSEIEGLAVHLRTRFEGGLLVTVGPPEYETRMAIIQKRMEAGPHELNPGVASAVGRLPHRTVTGLFGALDRILAVQDAEGRKLSPDEVSKVLAAEEEEGAPVKDSELGRFLDEISLTVADKVRAQEEEWRRTLRELAETAERDGFRVDRIRGLMDRDAAPSDLAGTVADFKARIRRLKDIGKELDRVGNPWPEAAYTVLKDPQRLEEAEALLASARERARAFPPIPQGPDLRGLQGKLPKLVVRAADQLIHTDRPEYSPLYLWSPGGAASRLLLQSTARTAAAGKARPQVALISAGAFADEFIAALSSGVAGAWRERWWTADLLFVERLEEFADTERAQEELFQLMEALHRRKARIMISGDRPVQELGTLDDRLRKRLEKGLVLEVPVQDAELDEELRGFLEPGSGRVFPILKKEETESVAEKDRAWIRSFQPLGTRRRMPGTAGGADTLTGALDAMASVGNRAPRSDPWLPSSEQALWDWPPIEDRAAEELD